jgi:hypothetical protein
MDRITAALESADGLPGLLDAAWTAFEAILSLSATYADTDAGFFTALVYARPAAADGRDAIITAPSLPARPAGQEPDGTWRLLHGDSAGEAAAAMAALSAVLAARLTAAAGSASDGEDRAACLIGARHAREIHALLAPTQQ